jgi:hypothetical protein
MSDLKQLRRNARGFYVDLSAQREYVEALEARIRELEQERDEWKLTASEAVQILEHERDRIQRAEEPV